MVGSCSKYEVVPIDDYNYNGLSHCLSLMFMYDGSALGVGIRVILRNFGPWDQGFQSRSHAFVFRIFSSRVESTDSAVCCSLSEPSAYHITLTYR